MQWSDIPRHPTIRTLRQFGALCLLCFGGLAYRGTTSEQSVTLVTAFAFVALAGGLLAAFRPQLLRPVFVSWMMLAFPIGWSVSRVFLAVLYYGVLTPLAVAFRWLGRDTLGLRRDTDQESYWQVKPVVNDLSAYLRQY
jgi:hypothetical protein